jgi:hypothetical protein
MAQGSKYTDEQKEQALAMLTTMSFKAVSKSLKIPERTLRDWKDTEEKINPEFAELRNEKKKQFVESSWRIIEKANKLIEKKIDIALSAEEDIDMIMKKAKSNESLDKDDIVALTKNINKLNIENIGQVSTVIGTLYDKQALINKEATTRLGADKELEEVLKNLQGEEM